MDVSGTKLKISGWGAASFKGASSSVLKVATVTGISNKECAKKYAFTENTITDRMLCAAEKDTDTCKGDSGGAFYSLNKKYNVIKILNLFGI
jgi:hypothetical protein